jgi:sterol 3beta-glucosyltransferase
MIIIIIAPGSRGDVQPYVALGKGLKEAGHTVRLMASQEFRELVIENDLDFVDLGGSMQAVAQNMQALLEQGNFLKILSSMRVAAQNLVVQASQRGLEACRGSDLIIAGFGGLFVGLALSEKLGIPFIQAYYFPFTPTREFPNALVPVPPGGVPAWANRLTHRVAQQMLWQNVRMADNQARRQVLQMAPVPFRGPFASLLKEKKTILYGYSPLVIPPPKDWEDFIHVTGYWFLEPPDSWEPPADLLDFLRSGPQPVYIGFGSMVHSNPGETTDLVLRALALSGQRGVVSSGWGGLHKETLPETVYMTGSVPFNWLFPQMAVLVHHGGAGTTSLGLWAGVPSVITPFMGDQPFWGQRVYELGVGTRPIPRRRLTADRLAESIHQAVSNKAMRETAVRLGEHIREEHGVARAVAIIEQQAR